MKHRTLHTITFLQFFLVIFLDVSLLVLSLLSLITGDFTMFIVLLSLSYILTHTAMIRIANNVIHSASEVAK